MNKIPPLGFGTFRLRGKFVQQPLRSALKLGYRHIDTAAIYRNEKDIGNVLQETFDDHSGAIFRSDLWITSKLSPYNMKNPRAALLKTLDSLQIEYLDLYLIHWPALSRQPVTSPVNKKLRLEAWAVLNEAKREGLVRNIGVSNFTPQHIQELIDETKYGIRDMFVQMEIHPWYWRDASEIASVFAKENITITGYALLAEGKAMGDTCPKILDDIAAKYRLTRVQVVLAWALAKDWIVLAKSENKEHMEQNLVMGAKANALTLGDVAAIDGITTPEGEEKQCWDPRVVR